MCYKENALEDQVPHYQFSYSTPRDRLALLRKYVMDTDPNGAPSWREPPQHARMINKGKKAKHTRYEDHEEAGVRLNLLQPQINTFPDFREHLRAYDVDHGIDRENDLDLWKLACQFYFTNDVTDANMRALTFETLFLHLYFRQEQSKAQTQIDNIKTELNWSSNQEAERTTLLPNEPKKDNKFHPPEKTDCPANRMLLCYSNVVCASQCYLLDLGGSSTRFTESNNGCKLYHWSKSACFRSN